MKKDTHPKSEMIKAKCGCGNVIEYKSTRCEDLHLDICSNCHPFYTGEQRLVDTAGRIDKFKKRFGKMSLKS